MIVYGDIRRWDALHTRTSWTDTFTGIGGKRIYLTLKMASFSGVLKLTDLDDFISPSQVNFYFKIIVYLIF